MSSKLNSFTEKLGGGKSFIITIFTKDFSENFIFNEKSRSPKKKSKNIIDFKKSMI